VRSSASRLPGLDGLKGLAILCVVSIHAAPFEPGAYQDHWVNGAARLAVPTFLVVTGYLVGLRTSSRRELVRRFATLLRLHLLYGLLYWGLALLRDGWPGPPTWKGALLHFGEGSYPGQYFFVILLQVLLAAAVLPRRLWQSGAGVVGAGLLALAGFFVAWGVHAEPALLALPAAARRALGSINALWLWFYYFALGAWLGALAGRHGVAPVGRAAGLGLGALGIAVAAAGLPALPPWGLQPGAQYAKLAILAGSSLVALAVAALARAPVPRSLARAGADSFAIFVWNPALLAALGGLLGRPASPAASWLHVLAATALALGLARLARRHSPLLLP